MMSTRMRCAVAVLSLGVAVLCGCGATPTSPVVVPLTPSAAALGGNWLIVGSLPFSNAVGPVVNGNFGLAMTFAVAGNGLVVASSVNQPCGSFQAALTGPITTGTVASNGSFALAPVAGTTGTTTLTLSATAPASGANSFSGTYSYVSTGGCATTQSGSFTATKIADVTGTYVGTASFAGLSGMTFTGSQTATLTLNLQQGAALPGTTSTDQELLTGTITVKGLSCISTGTAAAPSGTTATSASGLLGTVGVVIFTMNDGSTFNLFFDDEDTGSTRLAVLNASNSGGACGTSSSGSFEIVKQ